MDTSPLRQRSGWPGLEEEDCFPHSSSVYAIGGFPLHEIPLGQTSIYIYIYTPTLRIHKGNQVAGPLKLRLYVARGGVAPNPSSRPMLPVRTNGTPHSTPTRSTDVPARPPQSRHSEERAWPMPTTLADWVDQQNWCDGRRMRRELF